MTEQQPSRNPLKEITQPFVDAARAPRALWGNNLQYLIEGFLYFGVINYLVIYCVENIGTNEIQAGWVVTVLAGGLTFSQFLFGGLAIYAITQLHGLKLKRWHKAVFIIALIAGAAVYYSSHMDTLVGVPRTILMRYVFVAVLAALIWLVLQVAKRSRTGLARQQ